MTNKYDIGDDVYVKAQDYYGKIVDSRKFNGKNEYLVRYSIPNGRKPFYETWWPSKYLVKSHHASVSGKRD
jgi:hypothetical protein